MTVKQPEEDEDDSKEQNWLEIVKATTTTQSYFTGATYDTKLATIPDDKRYLPRLDNHLVHREIGPGF